jgi:hypothetical protein
MKTRTLAVVMILGLALAAAARAQESEQDFEKMMQEYMEKYALPGEHHNHLEMLAGTWTTVSRFWPAPDAPVQETVGKGEHRMVLGGRFLETSYEGEFSGMPFSGQGMAGYDRYQNKYVETWGDTMGTMILISEGQCDGEGKVRTMVADFDDPMTQRRVRMRSVYRIQDADHYTLEMYGPDATGQEYKAFELAHTRSQ